MASFDQPSAAKRMICARRTTKYGNVYFRTRLSNVSRSDGDRSIENGLCLGIAVPAVTGTRNSRPPDRMEQDNTLAYLRRCPLSLAAQSEVGAIQWCRDTGEAAGGVWGGLSRSSGVLRILKE